jgi:derlin-1
MPAALGNDIQDWFNGLPFFTKRWFGLSVLFPLLGRFDLVSVWRFTLNWNQFAYKFHFWRPMTSLFYFPVSFGWVFNLYFLYTYSLRLESGVFDGRPAEYFFLLSFNSFCCVAAGFVMSFPYLMWTMVMSLIYIWCMINKDYVVHYWFGIQLKARYLPWVMFALSFICNYDGRQELIGIFVGHLYYFIMFKFPQDFGGPTLLATPQFMYNWFPNKRSRHYGEALAFERPNGGNQGGRRQHDWEGIGHRLGQRL